MRLIYAVGTRFIPSEVENRSNNNNNDKNDDRNSVGLKYVKMNLYDTAVHIYIAIYVAS